MTRVTAVLLLLTLLLLACGPDEAPPIEVPSWAHVAPEQIAEAKKYGVPVAFENDLGMRFVLIPAGTFLMGSPEAEEGRDGYRSKFDVERQHEVAISTPFYLQVTEVTLSQYRSLHGHHTLDRQGGWAPTEPGFDQARLRWPVVYVSQQDASLFAAWLGEQDDRNTYRLPTEAEWEYACRAGGTLAFGHRATLTESDAWIDRSEGGEWMTEVAQFRANSWGLHDMQGNAMEWCLDTFAEYAADPQVDPLVVEADGPCVARGGAFNFSQRMARCAARSAFPCDMTVLGFLGFRLVSPLPEPRER
jgi:formylglycine-generating enzyme required for sulfatase activity